MENFVLEAKARPETAPKKLRNDGFIPAVIYGQSQTEVLAVPASQFEKVFKKAGESTIITLNIDGKSRSVKVQDIQKHYLTGKIDHVDFFEVNMKETLKATVPLEFVGVSKAVKEAGGTLVQVLNEVEVECLPADLPHAIEADISVLNDFHDHIKVKDLKVSDKVQVMNDPEEVVAKVDAPRDVEAELAEPVVEDVSKVEGAAEPAPVAEGAEEPEKAE